MRSMIRSAGSAGVLVAVLLIVPLRTQVQTPAPPPSGNGAAPDTEEQYRMGMWVRPIGEPTDQLYTEAQARSGQALFLRNCGRCHIAGPLITREMLPPGAGFHRPGGGLSNLGGQTARKYPAVYHLFRRIRDSMPAGNPAAVSPQNKVDIIAFILKANGFPAGATPLPVDVEAMKRMPLNEQGFDRVFNGKDFTGIGVLIGTNCRPAPLGCGSVDPGTTIWVDRIARELVTTGRPTGYWYPEKQYLNFDLRFDQKFDRPADLDPDDDFFDGNSGVMFPFQEHWVMPAGRIEVQGQNSTLGQIHLALPGATIDERARMLAQRPVGQWNSIRVVNLNKVTTAYVNGVEISRGAHEYGEPGYIGFQIEGAAIHWRNIRIKPL